MLLRILAALLLLSTAACTLTVNGEPINGDGPTGDVDGETGTVVEVIDGDTIDVDINGEVLRVRYVGMNTPERDEACYQTAKDANRALVSGQTVLLVTDSSDTDRFGRLLRYIYVGDVFVNARLVKEGYAEVVSYPPDTQQFDYFKSLEVAAANAGLGCHATGIFNDGNYER